MTTPTKAAADTNTCTTCRHSLRYRIPPRASNHFIATHGYKCTLTNHPVSSLQIPCPLYDRARGPCYIPPISQQPILTPPAE